MTGLESLWLGVETALSLHNLLVCLGGVTLGTLIGVLPGMGPVATVAMLLPLTFSLEPTSALIGLAGIYYGAQYGGSTTAVLVNIPGDAGAVVTCLDGYKMARQGRAGVALGIAATGSFLAGTVATGLIAFFAEPLSRFAFEFSPADLFSLMLLGLVGAVVLARADVGRSVGMLACGLLLGTVGTDMTSGALRYTGDVPELMDGIGFVALSMGLYGVAEILRNLEGSQRHSTHIRSVGRIWPSLPDLKAALPAMGRGTLLGSLLGVLPGGGALLSSFASYSLEKELAGKNAQPPFGEGNLRGVAGPESANNAGAQTSFIPMLTLGIPSNAVMALLIGALMMHNITPGPTVIDTNPALFWGLIASMWLGNLFLLILNLPLIGVWVQVLRLPYRWLFPAVLLFCALGVYSVNEAPLDGVLMMAFGLVGYIAWRLDCECTPLILGFVLGPMLEENLRRALVLSRGDLTTFIDRPLSVAFLSVALLLVLSTLIPRWHRTRAVAFQAE